MCLDMCVHAFLSTNHKLFHPLILHFYYFLSLSTATATAALGEISFRGIARTPLLWPFDSADHKQEAKIGFTESGAFISETLLLVFECFVSSAHRGQSRWPLSTKSSSTKARSSFVFVPVVLCRAAKLSIQNNKCLAKTIAHAPRSLPLRSTDTTNRMRRGRM
jgi:hypothetical protein